MEITRSKRLAGAGIAIAALTAGGITVGAAPANASVPPAKCGTVNPAKATGVHTARTTYLKVGSHKLKIEVRYGNLSGHQYAWSRITNAAGGHLRKYDRVWLDVTNNGGHTHAGPCGLKQARGTETNIWSTAVRTSNYAKFQVRAVGAIYHPTKNYSFLDTYTSWW